MKIEDVVTAIGPAAAARCGPGLPCDAEGPVFREPWQAPAFAMAVALHRRELFRWDELAATLGGEIKAAQRAGDPDAGGTYYCIGLRHASAWSPTRASPIVRRTKRYHDAREHAADRTPHGAPIELRATDFAGE